MQWSQISASEKYKSLTPEQQAKVQDGYFNQYIAPKVEQSGFDPEEARTKFRQKIGAAVMPQPEAEKPGFFGNMARGIGERATDLAGGFVSGLGSAAEAMPTGVAGAPSYAQSMLPQRSREERKAIADSAAKDAKQLQAVDLNYDEQRNTLEGAKAKFEKGDWLGAATELTAAGINVTGTSLPDMVGAAAAPGLYTMSRTGELSQSRAENKGMARPTSQEAAEALPFAVAQSALERILPSRLFRGKSDEAATAAKEAVDYAKDTLPKRMAKKAAEGAAIEGATEFIQEGVLEYIGTRYGTDAQMSAQEGLSQGLEAAILGSIGGGALGGLAGIPKQHQPEIQGEESPEDLLQVDPDEQQPAAGLEYNPQRMITMPDGTTAWESEADQLRDMRASGQHPARPQTPILDQTPEDIEQELGATTQMDQVVDAEMAAIFAELEGAAAMSAQMASPRQIIPGALERGAELTQAEAVEQGPQILPDAMETPAINPEPVEVPAPAHAEFESPGAQINPGLFPESENNSRIAPEAVAVNTARAEQPLPAEAPEITAPAQHDPAEAPAVSTIQSADLPPILTTPKAKFLKDQAKAQKLKKNSPGYADALARIGDEYESEVDRAQASLPFEKFNELNSDTPETLNRQAWQALRDEFEITQDHFPNAGKMVGNSKETLTGSPESSSQPIVDNSPQSDTDRIAQPAPSAASVEIPAPKSKPSQEKTPLRQRKAQEFIGAKVGEQVTPSADFDYLTGGRTYTVEGIQKNGDVTLTSERGSTTVSMGALLGARTGGITFAKVETKQTPQSLFEIDGDPISLESAGELRNSKGYTERDNKKPAGVPLEQLQQITADFFDRFPGAAEGISVRLFGDETRAFGPNLTERDRGKIKGGFNPETGDLVLIAANLNGAADAQETLQHEILVHHGMGFLPEAEITEALNTVKKAILEDRQVNKIWQEIEKTYGDKPVADQLEEVLARIAEKLDTGTWARTWNNVLLAIRKALAKLGLIKPLARLEDLKKIIYDFARSFEEGKSPGRRDGGMMQARRAEDSQSFAAPDESLEGFKYQKAVDTVLRVWADKMRPLLNTQREIQKATGEKLSEDVNAYLAEELFHGKTENDLRKLNEIFVEPLAKKMAEYKIERAELDMYLWAAHAPERNKQIAKINPEMKDGGSGMTNAQALKVLKQIKDEGKLAKMAELSQFVYGMLKQRRDIMKGALQDEETIDAWDTAYKYYVPLKGRAADESGGKFPRVGKGFDIRGKETIRALGRRTKPESPALHAIRDTTETIIRYRKNEVGKTFLNLVQKYPNPDYWNVYTQDSPELQPRLKTAAGKEVVGESPVINKNKYFITKKNGKEYYIDLKDEKLLRAMKNMGPEPMNMVMRFMGATSRFLSAVNTSYNPEFTITNFARDIQTAMINMLAEQDLHDGRAKGEKIVASMVKGTPIAIRAIHASLRDKQLTGEGAEWQKVFDQFRDDGAKTGWFDMKDIDGQAAQLESLINMQKGDIKGRALRARKAIGDFVDNLNGAIENGVRLSAYKAALDAGISRNQAASLAKNLTVNFNRKGEIGQALNSLYMFANASIQGTAAFARAIGTLKANEDGTRSLNMAQKVGIGIAGSSFALALLNREMAGEDDDGENWYDKVPDYVKERNIVIMKSIAGGDPGKYWTIPLPYGYNIFNVIGTSAEAAAMSDKGIGEGAANIAKAFFGSFSPLGIAQSDSLAGSVSRTMAPTIAKPFVDMAANENFFGSPIYRENLPFGAPRPESHLHKRSTPEAWKWVAEFINDATGGSAYRSGMIDVSPDKLDYVFDYVTGGAGTFVSRTTDVVLKTARDREIETKDIPFVRKVSGEVGFYPDQNAFYDRKNEISQMKKEWESLKGAERLSFRKEHGNKIRLNDKAKSVEKELKRLRKQRDAIEQDETLADRVKDSRIKLLEKQMKVQVDRFNKVWPD